MRNILSGAAANLYGQAVTIGTQLVSVPILIGAWGLHGFGLWTMLVTVPTLLLAMDFGYSAAAAGMMSKAIALGDEDDARVSLHTAFAMVSTMSIAMLAFAIWLGIYVSGHRFDAHAGMSASDAHELATTLPYLIAYVAITLQSGLLNAVYRVNGYYPLGVLIYETARLIEQSLVMFMAVMGGNLVEASIAMIVARVAMTIVSTGVMMRVTSWVELSFAHFSGQRLQEMFKPAMAAMFIPLCVLAGVQGVTIVVGVFLAPAAAGSFATLRVLFRMVVQVVGTLSRASVPEFALTFARDDSAAKVRIARFTFGILVAGATLGSIGVLLLGPAFVRIWTGGKVELPYILYVIMVGHAFFGCIWNGLSNLIMGVNLHSHYVPQLLVWNLLSVGSLFILLPRFHLSGAAACVAVIDVLSFISVYRVWSRVVPVGWRGHLADLRTAPHAVAAIANRIRLGVRE